MHATTPDRIRQEFLGFIWTSGLTERLLPQLCRSIGSRPFGSAALQQAFTLLQQELRTFGLPAVELEAVQAPYSCTSPQEAVLRLEGERLGPVSAFEQTRGGSVTGPLIYGGYGSEGEIRRALQSDTPCNQQLLVLENTRPPGAYPPLDLALAEACRQGVGGVVIIASVFPGGLPLLGSAGKFAQAEPFPLPVIGVSREVGAELKQACKTKRQAELEVQVAPDAGRCQNLSADVGCLDAPELYLIGAHLDSLAGSSGACDNASGVCLAVEIACALHQVGCALNKRWRLVLFTGEESGYLGSRSYVQTHGSELDAIRFVITFDEIYWETAQGLLLNGTPELVPYFQELVSRSQRSLQVVDGFGLSSDYLPFALQGVPSARQANLTGPPPLWPHSAADTADKVSIDAIKYNGVVFGSLLLELASDSAPFPGRRKTAAEVKHDLTRRHLAGLIDHPPYQAMF